MNYRYVGKVLGMLIAFISATMALPLGWSLAVGEMDMAWALAKSMAAGIALGGLMFFVCRKSEQEFYRREGLLVVCLGWIAGAAVGALPFWLCPEFHAEYGFTDAYFEAMSGFTTTGSTVLRDIEAMPQGFLLWRSFTQWLGGMGIVVLFVAVLPALGVEAKHLYKVEVPGIKKEGSTPRIRDAASLLWKIYLGMTVAQTLLLMAGGMTFFDAINHTFTTLATGGFSTKNKSIAHYDSLYIEVVIIVFMVLVGTNFALYVSLLRGRLKDLFWDPEYRVYLILLAVSTLVVAAYLSLETKLSPGRAVRDSAFQVVSMMTTTGYCTADFDKWPQLTRMLLVALMFVGGCAGSTGGSMKVIRWVVVFKMAFREVQKFFMPRLVKQVRVGRTVIPEDTLNGVAGFFILFMGVWIFGSLFMSTMTPDLETAVTSVIAALGNIGPGLAKVGAVENFGWMPAPGKWFLSMCMVLGRLELYTVLVLFAPSFWKE